MQFTVLDDFWSSDTQSQYCAGLSYAAADDKLRDLVGQWVAVGKVELGGPVAQMSGKE